WRRPPSIDLDIRELAAVCTAGLAGTLFVAGTMASWTLDEIAGGGDRIGRDAEKSIAAAASGIIVPNHGGRDGRSPRAGNVPCGAGARRWRWPGCPTPRRDHAVSCDDAPLKSEDICSPKHSYPSAVCGRPSSSPLYRSSSCSPCLRA